MPSLPPVPHRSRRQGSDTSFHKSGRHGGSIGGLGDVDEETGPKYAADEALKLIWADFCAAADNKVVKICARPLVSARGTSR